MNILHAPIEVGDRCAEMLADVIGGYRPITFVTGEVAGLVKPFMRYSFARDLFNATPTMFARLNDFDLYHFHCGMTLQSDMNDLVSMHDEGVPVVMSFWGAEVRQLSKAREWNPFARVICQDDTIIQERLKRIGKYIKHCIVPDDEVARHVEDYIESVHVIPHMVDMKKLPETCLMCKRAKDSCSCLPGASKEINRGTDAVVVVHVPSNEYLKGTKEIVAACEVVGRTIKMDLRIVRGVPRSKVIQELQKADLVIDDMHRGTLGRLTVEALALGKPTITWVCDNMREQGHYDVEPPVFVANQNNLKDCIGTVLLSEKQMLEANEKARPYVNAHHSVATQIDKLIKVYDTIQEECNPVERQKNA
jgi:glycosyltransferase involved in cell wall biosynthesis